MYPKQTKFAKKPTVNRDKGENPSWLKAPDPVPVGSPQFIAEMDEVLEIAGYRSRDEWPGHFFERYGMPADVPEPLLPYVTRDGKVSVQEAAELVRMDRATSLFHAIKDWLNARGKFYHRASVPHDTFDFIGNAVHIDAVVAFNITRALDTVFLLKNLWDRPRFEEWFGHNLTAYEEGCPGHPGDPAGHGAAAGASCKSTINHFPNLSRFEITVSLHSGLHFASYRTPAGMHRQRENLTGFVVGWATIGKTTYAAARDEIKQYLPKLVI